MSLFDDIRNAARAVMNTARLIRINTDRVAEVGDALREAVTAPVVLDATTHHVGRGEATLAFLLTLDTVNFGSGWFPHLRKRPGMSGYFTVAASLKDQFDAHGAFSANALAGLSAADCTRIFGQDPANQPAQELMRLFAEALNALGRHLIDHFCGSFPAMVESAGGSAQRLVGELARMPFYNDVERYGSMRVPFFKRAQIAAANLALAFDGGGWGRFDDLGELTMFADNLVPHVLRVDGVLEYDPGLLQRINREELIAAGSAEEVEIRAAGVHAVELLREHLRQRGVPTTSSRLDFLLWNRGQGRHYKSFPRHRARSVYY